MMETVHIRKSGFPIRYAFDEFARRFRVLLPSAERTQVLPCPRPAASGAPTPVPRGSSAAVPMPRAPPGPQAPK